MLELILSVIDRVIVLARGRVEGRRQLYREAIDPLFLDLVSVHSDYVRVFTEIESISATEDIFSPNSPPGADPLGEDDALQAVKNLVNERRLQLEPVREKLKALAEVLSSEELPREEVALVRAIGQYFEFATVSEYHSAYTSFLEFLSHLPRRAQIAKQAGNQLSALRENWSYVTECYAIVRVAVAKIR